jgi:ASC-1-like (ASCH) protein
MNRRRHVAVLKAEYIEAILDGRKTVESRLSRTRREPLHAVRVGDEVYFKQSSGGYRAAAKVRRVEFHEDLSPRDVRDLRKRLNAEVLASATYWRDKREAKYATLLWLSDVRKIDVGPEIDRLYGRAWVRVA